MDLAVTCALPKLEPPAELVAFVQRQVRNRRPWRDIERRSEARDLLVVPVVAQPVDENYAPIGEPLALVSRDMSSQGVGLVSADRIHHRHLTLEMRLADEDVKLIAEVTWTKAMGPFYYVGCRFVCRLEN